MPVHIFQAWVMEHLQQLIRFDSAWWGRATYSPETDGFPTVQGHYLFNLPDEYVVDWETVKHSDHIASRASNTPLKTLISGVKDPEMSTSLYSVLEKHKISHVICCVAEDPVIALNECGTLAEGKLIDFLSLYRSDPDDEFNHQEMLLLQCLLPHISEAVNQCAKHFLENQRQDQSVSDQRSMAITDRKGILHVMEPSFQELYRSEWPNWRGVILDSELLPFKDQRTQIYIGEKISITTERIGEFILMRLRRKSPIDDLSERELLVARMFSDGKTYKEIANELCRSPSTIRNHIQSIYFKLGIKNKAELVQLLSSANSSS